MNKQIVFFLVIAEGILLLAHWALYATIIYFLPGLSVRNTHILGIAFIIAAVSFFSASVLSYTKDTRIVRWFYFISACWMGFFVHGFLATIVIWFVWLVSLAIPLPFTISSVAAFIFALSVCLVVYGFINARFHRITKITVKLPNLPSYWEGKTAVLVTDTHVGHILRYGFIRTIVKAINKLRPEIVFMAGDFYDSVHSDFAGYAKAFRKITSRQGTYFVTGNHEKYSELQEHIEALQEAGIKIIDDQIVEVEGLQIIGVGFSELETKKSLDELLKSFLIKKNIASILLKHVPNNLEVISQAGISISMSGHTHEAQIWPFNYITRKIFKGYDYGLKNLGALQVYTSSGVGTWGPPVRIFTKSEIVQFTFLSGKS